MCGVESMSDAVLSDDWRLSIARSWQRILPLLRRRIEELQRDLDAEQDADARIVLGAEIALRRLNLQKAEAASGPTEDIA
jgi:hypothetical protein